MASDRRLSAEQRAKIFKALSDPHRLKIVDALAADGSMCGTQLAERLDVSLALLCHHWDVLIDAGVVRKERQGQLRVCSLDTEKLREATGKWDALSPRRTPKPRAAPKPPRAAPKPPRAAPKPPRAAPKPPRAAPKPPRAAPKPPRAAPKRTRTAKR